MGMGDGIMWSWANMHPLWKPVREDRTLEWITATAITFVGLMLVLPFQSLNPWYAPWWFAEGALGVAVLIAGIVNLLALWVNGRDDRTPTWRKRALWAAGFPVGALLVATLSDGRSCVDAVGPALLLVMIGVGIGRSAADATHIKARRDAGLSTPH